MRRQGIPRPKLFCGAWPSTGGGLQKRLGGWDQVKKFPAADLILQGFTHPECINHALVWVGQLLSNGGAKDYLTWDITCALKAGAESFPTDNQKVLANTLYQSIVNPKISSYSKDQLKEFVLGMADGRIWSTAHMSEGEMSNVNLVFMPLALGAFAVPSYAMPPEPEKPEKPEKPEEPAYPEEPPDLKLPKEPKDLEPDEVRLQELDMAIRWHRETTDAIERYKAELKVMNEEQKQAWLTKCQDLRKSHQVTKDQWEAAVDEIDVAHQVALTAHAATLATWDEDNAEQIRIRTEWEAQQEKQFRGYVNQIGVIWEWYKDAGPRTINGMPIFFSMQMLSKDDWERCRRALAKEQARREAVDDLFDDSE